MKMADNSLMIFKNNCESINRNCVEVESSEITKTSLDEIKQTADDGKPKVSSDISTQEEAVDDYLAGTGKTEFNDEFLNCTDENSEEGIYFKSENVLEINNDEASSELDLVSEKSEINLQENPKNHKGSNYVARNLKKRSIKCLNKMQIMENVVEGCNVQPSSPGHADERSEEIKIESEIKEELDKEQTNDTEDPKIQTEILQETTKPENGIKEEPDSSDLHGENYSNGTGTGTPPKSDNKRKSESQDFPLKRLKTEIQENFLSRDKIISDFIEMADCSSLDQITSFSEQLLVEVKTLNELAKEKEREWNNIIHLKKLKEELLLRMQRRKQILAINEKTDFADLLSEPQSLLKSNTAVPNKVSANGNVLRQKPKIQNNIDLNGSVDRHGKRLTLDVQSIIADYRQRHPESVPRRGRRIRYSQSEGSNKGGNSIINFSSVALGSGAQVRQGDVSNDLGLLLNIANMNRQDTNKTPSSDPLTPNVQETVSFKDMLLQFAKLSQNERNELIQNAIRPPPPYPEVTVHPVPSSTPPPAQNQGQTNSLLHGILTKSSTKNPKTSFSPTLARLLTAPERNAMNQPVPTVSNNVVHPSNMSISEILSTSKACNEITITPVDSQYESTPIKGKNLEEEETEDSADRLVIDENNDVDSKKQTNSDNNSDGGDDVPLCQGCNQKSAQFVCAGCGNQWYCSRDCQVNAWDEHSEVCSG